MIYTYFNSNAIYIDVVSIGSNREYYPLIITIVYIYIQYSEYQNK